MSVELKVKLKSLAEESRIIRKEELKRKGANWGWQAHSLWCHRVLHLRPMIRDTHIAYGIIKGFDYIEIEPTAKSIPNWKSIKQMVVKYGNQESLERFELIIENKEVLKLVA